MLIDRAHSGPSEKMGQGLKVEKKIGPFELNATGSVIG